jgi:hypothetical protein
MPLPANQISSDAAGISYYFGPDGAKFDKPVSIVIAYDLSQLPDVGGEASLAIAEFDASSNSWTRLASTVNTSNKTVSSQITHFSQYALLAEKKGAAPNPASRSNSQVFGDAKDGGADAGGSTTGSLIYWCIVGGVLALLPIGLIAVRKRKRSDESMRRIKKWYSTQRK